jgi:hypothetical protein
MNLDDDIIKVRDIIARVEGLEGLIEELDARIAGESLRFGSQPAVDVVSHKLNTLTTLLEEIKGLGRNQQWRGGWYPDSLIRNDYFPIYARKTAEEVGLIDVNAKWPSNYINWELAAQELRENWPSVGVDGVAYWVLGA